jgi:hypothetical protein
MATEILGESQLGGSFIGLMLDLTTDAFRNKWTEMELQLGEEQVRIGKRIVAWNLRKETVGKIAVLCDGVAKYPCSVLYDMGWQKASKTYDSLSGQGLMIGFRMKRVGETREEPPTNNVLSRLMPPCPNLWQVHLAAEGWRKEEAKSMYLIVCN